MIVAAAWGAVIELLVVVGAVAVAVEQLKVEVAVATAEVVAEVVRIVQVVLVVRIFPVDPQIFYCILNFLY